MPYSDALGNQGEPLTEDSAAPIFEHLLSLEEDPQEAEEPQTPKSPESESDTPDATEQSEEEEKSEETENDEESDTDQPNLIPVKINGVEEMVTVEELARGYSRTKDYTQKTQELATRRRELEEQLPAVRAERQKVAQYLTELEQALQSVTPEEPDWNRVQAEAPDEFPTLFAQWQAHEKRMHQIRAQREAAVAAVQQDNQTERQGRISAERDKLLEAVPDWKDPVKAKAEKSKLISFAVNDLGFTTQQLEEVEDHRMFLILRDAMRYRELSKNKPQLQQKIQAVKTATPGPASSQGKKPMSDATRAKLRLAKSGRQDDAAAFFEQLL